MLVTRSKSELPAHELGGSVVSIGVFDGVHKGHQKILADNLARARGLGARPSVVTFAGHPKELLLGRAPRTLTTLEHRLELFRRAGIEHALVLQFDEEVRSTPAEVFLSEVQDGTGDVPLLLVESPTSPLLEPGLVDAARRAVPTLAGLCLSARGEGGYELASSAMVVFGPGRLTSSSSKASKGVFTV